MVRCVSFLASLAASLRPCHSLALLLVLSPVATPRRACHALLQIPSDQGISFDKAPAMKAKEVAGGLTLNVLRYVSQLCLSCTSDRGPAVSSTVQCRRHLLFCRVL